MYWLDLIIIATIAWFTFSAFSSGLIREIVTVVAVVVGGVLAGRFYTDLAENIEFLISDDTTRSLVAFVAIFAGIVVVGHIGGITLRRLAAILMLGPFDRLGGALFGFAKGLLLVEILLIAVSAYPVSSRFGEAIDRSALAPVFLDGVPVMLRLLPDEFSEALETLDPPAVDAVTPPL